ncbi:hypothetical protein LDENG_00097930 [Lucifuga dentata]|nr:hypothetical protein LDENG_00097930 [Lucifuga dentata]
MLDQSWSATRSQIPATSPNYSENAKGFPISNPRPPGYGQAACKKTVKELLKLKRKTLNHAQQDNNTEHEFGFVTPAATPVNPSITSDFIPDPEINHVTPQQQHHPALLQTPTTPTVGVKMNLFQWQIQQESARIEGVSPELLNMQDEDGDTFLHIAVAQGRRALAYVLAGKMAQTGSLDVKEQNGQTALQVAVVTNQYLIVQDLLTHGAQINTRDLWGHSPLHMCAEKGHFLSLHSIHKALTGSKQATDIEKVNYEGLTPLHVAVLAHNKIVKEMRILEGSCSFSAMELMQKRQMCHFNCIKTLLLMGASCGAFDLKSGRTSLHMASEEANVELFELFLNLPSWMSVVNMKTFSGNTALHVVSSLQNHKAQVEAVRLLLRRGADPGARNLENDLPSHLVPEGPMGEKVRLMLKGKRFPA